MAQGVASSEHKVRDDDFDEYQIIPYETLKELVPYPRCSSTKTIYWFIIALSSAMALTCIILAIMILTSAPTLTFDDIWAEGGWAPPHGFPYSLHETTCAYRTTLSAYSGSILSFVVSVVVTACADALGLIHATSLRWALYRERRLTHNTNMRLFRSARSLPHHWITNFISGLCLAICYAASSVLFVNAERITFVSSVALCFLGVGLAGQAMVALLCMRNADKRIPTWSSNPLANAMASLHGQGGVQLETRPGRCMHSFWDTNAPVIPCAPRRYQKPLGTTPGMPRLMGVIWFIGLLPLVWAIIMRSEEEYRWPIHLSNIFPYDWSSVATSNQMVRAIVILLGIQAIQVTGLHCMELVINMDRDEETWRRATTAKGAILDQSPLKLALTSWRALLLIIIKSILHWMLGEASGLYVNFRWLRIYDIKYADSSKVVPVQGRAVLQMDGQWVFYYAGVAAAAALIATLFVIWPREGPQPATYGHLQTLADLVDEWPSHPEGKLWWGDKGVCGDGVTRHAGTSTDQKRVGDIIFLAEYV